MCQWFVSMLFGVSWSYGEEVERSIPNLSSFYVGIPDGFVRNRGCVAGGGARVGE